MAKYSGGAKDAYAKMLMAEYYGRTLGYYKGEVQDDDYFDPVVDMLGEAEAERRVFSAFDRDELIRLGVGRDCFSRDPQNGRAYGAKKDFCFQRDDATDTLQNLWNNRESREPLRKMLVGIVEDYRRAQVPEAVNDPLKSRFEQLKAFFKLDELELAILQYGYVRSSTVFGSDPFSSRRNTQGVQRIDICAMAVDHAVSEVRAQLRETSRLQKYDFVDSDLDLEGSLRDFLDGKDEEPLQSRYFRKLQAKEILPMSFYGRKLQTQAALLKRLIRSQKGERGVNVLLYGAPGTGKASFVQSLARELKREPYEVTQATQNGDRTTRASRIIGVQLGNEQLPRETSLLVVDEADEVLETNSDGGLFFFMRGSRPASEKGEVNTMLDSIRVPTFWISNAPAGSMADSVRRRFDYSICFHELTHEMRVNIWRNNVKKLKLGKLIHEEMFDELASKYATNAGGITMVLKNLKDLSPKPDEVKDCIKSLMEPHCELLGVGATDDRLLPAKDYSLEGLNIKGEVPLERIASAVENFLSEDAPHGPDQPRMNLLLWGPPGTGKTEFVKYLGKRLNRKVRVAMGSDMLSMWVGGTEANIRNAFRAAEESGEILFLDEIDGLVQDRSGASKSWEVTQVNELLHQMENFKGVMVGATNFMDNLDSAIMRRFTFKLQFDYLNEAGKRLFFERMFKTQLGEEDAAKLAGVSRLAPGDFRTVRQSMYYLGGDVTNAQRIAALAKESSLKKGGHANSVIGFKG